MRLHTRLITLFVRNIASYHQVAFWFRFPGARELHFVLNSGRIIRDRSLLLSYRHALRLHYREWRHRGLRHRRPRILLWLELHVRAMIRRLLAPKASRLVQRGGGCMMKQWMGKPLSECSREELIACVEALGNSVLAPGGFDYRELLKRYIWHVEACEGTDFIRENAIYNEDLLPEQLADLKALLAIREEMDAGSRPKYPRLDEEPRLQGWKK